MSVLRDLLRSTAAETLLRPTSVLRSSVTTPAASGTAGRTSRPVRWCCCNVESSTVFRSRQASQQTRALTGQSSCESAVCATPSGAFARQDVRDFGGHSLSAQCRAAHTEAQPQEADVASDGQADGDDNDLIENDVIDDEDDLDDDELQQMLQDNEADAGAMTDTANTDWGAKGLLVAQQVLQQDDMQELALFSLMASPKHKQLKIRLDKPEDEYGSPSLDEIALFSRHYSEEYHKAIGEAAEEVAVEVSSPGAERQVRVPQDLQRFQHLPMLVTFQLQDSNKVDTKVMELVEYNEADSTAEWKLADVRQNRSGKGVSKLSKKQSGQRWNVALEALQKVNLHLEV
ncbi:hypothetical protein WJX82_004269 [Trebouxia sp. C0006]